MKPWSFTVNAAAMVFIKNEKVLYCGGKICKDRSVEDEINHQVQRAHDCFRRSSQATYHIEREGLRLKARLLQAEVVETQILRVRHIEPGANPLTRTLDSTPPPPPPTLHRMKTEERVDRPTVGPAPRVSPRWVATRVFEATVRKDQILFDPILGENRLRNIALLGEWEGDERLSGGQECDWLKRVQEDLTTFGIVTKQKGWEMNAKRELRSGSKGSRWVVQCVMDECHKGQGDAKETSVLH